RAGLLLAQREDISDAKCPQVLVFANTQVLTPHADDIAAALAGIERECESEPRLASDRMVKFELRDLVFGPGMKAAALPALEFHASARIGFDGPLLEAPLHQAANRLE